MIHSPAFSARARLPWGDVAKGICIALVVMMHSTHGVQEAFGTIGWLDPIVAFAKPFRIPAFFLIAGFFFASMLGRSWRTLIDRRILHFAYFLVLWSLLMLMLKGGLLAFKSPEAAISWFARSLVEPHSALWFIHALIIFGVVARATAHLSAAMVISMATALHLTMPETGWLALDEFNQRFVFFVAGCRMAPHVADLARWAATASVRSFAIVLAAAIGNALAVWPELLAFGIQVPLAERLLSLVLGFTGALSLVIISVQLARIAPSSLAYLGRNSLSIYVAFTFPMAATRMVLIKSGLITDVGLVSLLVWMTALLTPLAAAVIARRIGLAFLFDKPGWVRLGERRYSPRLQPAE